MHKLSLVTLVVVVALASPCLAQYESRGFALERWDEDYSYLRSYPDNSDPLNRIKYIPLNGAGDFFVSFGGQARYRYDYFNNRDFGQSSVNPAAPATDDEDGFHLQRYLVHADVHLGEHLRTFVQLDSSFVDGRVGGGRYGDANHLDLQQAFVDVKSSEADEPYLVLRLGRQELIYGAQRFVSPDDWRNVRRSFDGARLSISVPDDTLDMFVTRPALIERDQFDNDDPGSVFWGVYNATALPQCLENANSKLEFYLLGLNQTADSAGVDSDTYTLGARFSTRPSPVDFDIEGDWQFGSVGSSALNAWSIASEAGYTFVGMTFAPRASLGFDIASGSSDADGRFNQLFPPTYNYLGHLYLFGRTNLIDAHAGVDLHLNKDLILSLAHHVFWRQNTDDAVYALGSGVVRADNGSDAAYVGNEFDIVANWQINRHISGYIGWAHFFAGDFLAETGASRDVDFLYASITYTF